ncbi:MULTISPECIES: endonuclease/exonuclease/phosphatase family protein [Marinobacter]|uniref:Endonuclease/exonuclease/phosphatase family protein n=1 Tax=Marinobacter xiaoshiensis TaxID=3073652 RepID=A0ABU2HK49_9GAMM|nr:endonuclease/exonuclease/phosphatase family protein [Marinobacter sp. F60267]MDS1311448.1 endonuclease/exonuclease/phosphatase family protein [Marinobacter sp. F60267]
MELAVLIATGLLVAATLLPLSRHPHWFVRGMDFPRLQLAVIAAVLILIQVLLLDHAKAQTWILVSATAVCLAWQLWWVLPYTVFWRAEVKAEKSPSPDRKLSILTANVLTPNKQADALLRLVNQYKPDVLVTLESDAWWQGHLDTLQQDMPYSMKCPLDNLYGMHVYSRLQLDETEISYLVEEGIPSMHALLKLRTGDQVRVHFLHPAPPSPTENPESAERDAELVIVARTIVDSDQPVIVTGDLNDVAWSATTRLFRKLSGLLDPRVGRGMFNTFHAKYPFLRWPLDHLFHSHHFTVSSIKRLPYFGSDHFGLFTELSFRPVRGKDQEGVRADADDESWANSIADEQDVDSKDVPAPGE